MKVCKSSESHDVSGQRTHLLSISLFVSHRASLHKEAGNTWCKSCALCLWLQKEKAFHAAAAVVRVCFKHLRAPPSIMCVRHAWYKQYDDVESCFICTVFCVDGTDVVFMALSCTVTSADWFLTIWGCNYNQIILNITYLIFYIVIHCSQKLYHVALIDFQIFFWRLSKCQVVLYTVSQSCLASKAVEKVLKLTHWSGTALQLMI